MQEEEEEPKAVESSLPSATTSHGEEVEEEEVDKMQEVDAAQAEANVPAPKRRRLRKAAPSTASSQSKTSDVKDDGNSAASPRAAPLQVSLLAAHPPPESSEAHPFGGPVFSEPDTDEDEPTRYVLIIMLHVLVMACVLCLFAILLCSVLGT